MLCQQNPAFYVKNISSLFCIIILLCHILNPVGQLSCRFTTNNFSDSSKWGRLEGAQINVKFFRTLSSPPFEVFGFSHIMLHKGAEWTSNLKQGSLLILRKCFCSFVSHLLFLLYKTLTLHPQQYTCPPSRLSLIDKFLLCHVISCLIVLAVVQYWLLLRRLASFSNSESTIKGA